MNVRITTFTNPFSFFCVSDDNSINRTHYEPIESSEQPKSGTTLKSFLSDVNHGQYVLVMWRSKWSRGVVNMKTQYLIWLIDYGIFIRPNEKTIFIDLPSEYKKYPSKIFEASIHGVVPIDKILCVDGEVTNQRRSYWNEGSLGRAQFLLKNAIKTVFNPIAILTTKHNDIVLGDLIIYLAEGKVNLINELEQWPGFLERDQEAYIKDLSSFYTSRRHHRACILKPSIPNFDLPYLTLQTASIEYFQIIRALENKLQETRECSDISDETYVSVSTAMCKDVSAFNITPRDIEKYSKKYITINERNYNVLHILINKARDLRMCELYKDYDGKSIGRACYYNARSNF